jgi:hypothetical protein
MPSFNLTPESAKDIRPCTGLILLKVTPPETVVTDTESGNVLIHLPESAAVHYTQEQSLRRAVVVALSPPSHQYPEFDINGERINTGDVVYYLGRNDEKDNEYVLAKHGQIQAVEVTE